ncbi:hypothetical protein HanIR_Chr15g0732621 [Helianthus annuus]|nr:hypothetical protein HanIR_Chr15g0732621 [Helianthus annuus]
MVAWCKHPSHIMLTIWVSDSMCFYDMYCLNSIVISVVQLLSFIVLCNFLYSCFRLIYLLTTIFFIHTYYIPCNSLCIKYIAVNNEECFG